MPVRRLRHVLAVAAVAVAGATLGLLLGGATRTAIGPFDAELALRPALTGDTVVSVPPLGSLVVDSHDGPVRLAVRLAQLRQADAEQLLRDPDRLEGIGGRAAADLRAGVLRLAAQAAGSAALGAVALALLVFRTPGRAGLAGWTALALAGLVAAGGAWSWRADALREPTYDGLLTNAPAVVGSAQDIVWRFDVYRRQLAGLVTNLSRVYAAVSTLPAYEPGSDTIRVLHVSDLHLNPSSYDVIESVVEQFAVDAVVDTGDVTDHGSVAENRYLSGIARLGVPYVFVRGNHDSAATQAAAASQPNAVVLDGAPAREVAGLVFLGQGDPRFTPDKTTRDDGAPVEEVEQVGRELARIAPTGDKPVDVLVVHDPVSAGPLAGVAPVILAGHAHEPREEWLEGGTLLRVEGSTGGAGLRGLQDEEPTPLSCSVLYFSQNDHTLQAYDQITLGGLGDSEVRITRHVVAEPSLVAEPSAP